MPYLVDADVFLRAKRDHYRFNIFPCFWDWLVEQGKRGVVLSVIAVKRELVDPDIATWADRCKDVFLEPDEATTTAAQRVSEWVQAPLRPYIDSARAEFFAAADYWLISQALAHGFTVVTHEVPAPLSKRRVKIPDVCSGVGVPCLSPFDMLQAEGIRFA